MKLLKYAVDPSGAGQGLYYSYNTNLTLSEQRNSQQKADDSSKLAWQQAEPRFFWNRFLAQPLTGAHESSVIGAMAMAIMHSECALACSKGPIFNSTAAWYQQGCAGVRGVLQPHRQGSEI